MYFVDKNKLIERLDYITKLSEDIKGAEGYALERISHMLIESTVDVGNMIIDAFILRDPGSYSDVMDIMALEGVITDDTRDEFLQTFQWRTILQREYTEIDHDQLKMDFLKHLSAYATFKSDVEQFFENENQSITAFGNH